MDHTKFHLPMNARPDPELTAVLRSEFPAGSAQGKLVATLRQQNFHIEPKAHSAEYAWGGVACTFVLHLNWSASHDGTLNDISGRYGEGCL
jgi:hypothetical protein